MDKAREELERGRGALDAVEAGVNAVELDNQEQYYVGYGGFPNAAGAMELDAGVMEGTRRCALVWTHARRDDAVHHGPNQR